ncbi:MAG: hypothetical protein CSA62_05175 [Planctomycetota bacterium]|nr:MAG: hypothetical protein CSA62_05175 [Planctomycetota bacterium]
MSSHSDKNKLTRRSFLARSAGMASALAFPVPLRYASGAFAPDPRERPVLVVVFLRGGQDPLQTLVPYKDADYYAMRPTIAIPAKAKNPAEQVIPLTKAWGLHPSLGSLKALWDEGCFAPLICTGSPHPTRSHFDAQDFMEYAAPGLRGIRDGWLNRFLAQSSGRWGKDSELRGLAMQNLLPRSLRGEYPVLAVPRGSTKRTDALLDFFDDLYLDDTPKKPEPSMGAGMQGRQMDPAKRGKKRAKRRDKGMMERREDPVVATGRATIQTLRRYREIESRGQQGSKLRYPTGSLGPRLERIAKVIKSGEAIEVACADWNGWDHHARQGGLEGRYTQMISHVADSIGVFLRDLGPHKKRTLVVTMSEFGRTCRENGNSGTDHGHGGMMMLCGGPVRGKKVYGAWPGLQGSELYQGRDLRVSTDFRDVLNEILVRHMQWKTPRDFFPDYRPGRGPGMLG